MPSDNPRQSVIQTPPGYKHTEVGMIPEDWEIQSGEQITTLIGKGASPRWQGFEYTNSGMLFVTSENVRDGFLDTREPKYLPMAFHEKLKRTKLQKHDILINLVGASIGRSCQILDEIGEANVNQAVAIFRVREQFNSAFIACYFQAPTAVDRILGMQVDAARPNISLGDLRRFLIPLPTKTEQTAIAEALSDADALIASLEQLIAKKRQVKQGAMQELLTGRRRLPGFSGEWEVKRLGEVVDKFVNGGTPSTQHPEYWRGQIPWITGADILGQQVSEIRRYITEDAVRNSSTNVVEKGNLLLVSRTGVGKLAIAPFAVAISQDFTGVYVRQDRLIPEFLFRYFDYNSELLRQQNQGTSIQGITRETLASTPIPVPQLAEQAAIAAILSDMDAEIAALEAKLAKARQVKQGMMQELLTGRIRLV